MTRRFAVKKEIRSLGIDLCNSKRVVGTVVRGGLYLDGIAVLCPKPNRWNASIARGIVRAGFFPELKLIMIHDPERRLDSRMIETMTRLPVIEVCADNSRSEELGGFRQYTVAGKMLHVRTSLETRIVREVLERTWTMGSLPEPLRIAHLIAKSRFLGKNRLFWANK